jgi:ATP-dependent DNA helicase RecG
VLTEFKSPRSGLPGSLWETYAAIANSQDDVILLGVGDDGERGLAQEGAGRWTRYRLPEMGNSPHIDSDSPHKGCHSVHSGASDTDGWNELLDIAAVARLNNRMVSKEMEQLILKLCTGRWLTRRELGDLLRRNIESLRSRFLVPMVQHGLLRLRYPDKPNRVDQAYTAAEEQEETDA